MVSIWDIYERALSGRYVTELQFDTKILFEKIQELVKEYDIKYTPEEPVPSDRSLAKDAFKAGMRLLTEVGVLCIDTSRIISITEEEVKETLKAKRKEIVVGQGVDAIRVAGRKPEDKTPPLVCGGPCGGPISEETYVACLQSYAQEPLVNAVHTGSIPSIGGKEIRVGSPLELQAARCEGLWAREALNRANRPGMPIFGVMSAITLGALEVADLPGGLRPTDMHEICFLNELKTDIRLLNKVVYNSQAGNIITSCQCPIMGGFAGGPEGTAIVTIATTLQGFIMGGALHGHCPIHSLHAASTDRSDIWASDLHTLALRESDIYLPTIDYIMPSAGPCTEMIIYEIAAREIANITCGTSGIFSAGATTGAMRDHYSGMEGRIAGEIAHATAGMSRDAANNIANALLKKYEDVQAKKKAPMGKKFQECYDIKTLTPGKEYLELWEKVKKELEDLGVKL